MSREVVTLGIEDGFRVEIAQAFGKPEEWSITFWRRNYGDGLPFSFTSKEKAVALGQYLYDQLLPEFGAAERRQELSTKRHLAELRARPKPKPPKVLKKAPIIDVLVCGECSRLIPPDDLSDERVYECSRCNQVLTGDDARRCEQCNIFTAKISDTSCPECGGAMDNAEEGHAQRATNGELVRYFSLEELAAQAAEQAKKKADAQTAAAKAQRARDEKRERLYRVWGILNDLSDYFVFDLTFKEPCEFQDRFSGRKYRIEEID